MNKTAIRNTDFSSRATTRVSRARWAFIFALVILGGCTTAGGQSGGESDFGCREKSRSKVTLNDIASGFDTSPADAIKFYAQTYKTVLRDLQNKRAGDINFIVERDVEQDIAVVRREYREDPDSQGQTADFNPRTTDKQCEDVYAVPVSVALDVRLDKDKPNGASSISTKLQGTLLITPSNAATSLLETELASVMTLATPQLTQEGYVNVRLVLSLEGYVQAAQSSLSGRLTWQAERKKDNVASSKTEDIGSFTSP